MPPQKYMPRHAAVLGAGAWGTTLALHLAHKGLTVRLWAYEPETVQAIETTRQNSLYLPGIPLPEQIQATSDLSLLVRDMELLIVAVPSHAMRTMMGQLRPHLSAPLPVVIASKGIEEETNFLMSQVIHDVLPSSWDSFIMALTGPSFAAEVCMGKPTTILLAGQDPNLPLTLQPLFMSSSFRVYTSSDVIGAQLGGALKNTMAIAAGLVDGLELGLNTRAALITRGLAEIIRLGMAMGADVHTFYGLSGLGDLVLTCTGSLSRNYTVGFKIGQGQQLDHILNETATVAEGVRTTRAAVGLAAKFGVDMPIVQGVHAILFEGKTPLQAVTDLMVRSAKVESDLAMVTGLPGQSLKEKGD